MCGCKDMRGEYPYDDLEDGGYISCTNLHCYSNGGSNRSAIPFQATPADLVNLAALRKHLTDTLEELDRLEGEK